jgi:hypothetical protein
MALHRKPLASFLCLQNKTLLESANRGFGNRVSDTLNPGSGMRGPGSNSAVERRSVRARRALEDGEAEWF